MWDALITVGNLIIIPALLTTVLDRRAYIPRLSSGVSLIGLGLVIVGLVGGGFLFSPIVLGVIGAMWVFIFLFRAQPAGHEETSVVPEVGAEIHKTDA